MTLEERYLLNQGLRCPVCMSEDILSEQPIGDSGEPTQDVKCVNCGSEWTDIYTLTEVRITKTAVPTTLADFMKFGYRALVTSGGFAVHYNGCVVDSGFQSGTFDHLPKHKRGRAAFLDNQAKALEVIQQHYARLMELMEQLKLSD